MKVVADASVLIALAKIGRLDLLEKLWKVVFIPEEVRREVLADERPGCAQVCRGIADGWLVVKAVGPEPAVPGLKVASGEAACLRLAVAEGADLVLADDRLARKAVRRMGFPVVGTLKVLALGVERGIMSAGEFGRAIDDLAAVGFWLEPELVQTVRRELGID